MIQRNFPVLDRLAGLILVLCLLLLPGCETGSSLAPLPADAVVLAFGDSLTHGTGASPGQSYPDRLAGLIGRKVVNAGVPGEISAAGARRLPGLLDRYQPDLLLLCHGGNDLLRKLDQQQLRDNLRRMFEAANQRSVPVVMIAVPRPGLLLDDADLYRQIAADLQIPLVEDVLADLLGDRQYKSDRVHPNAAGYQKLAEAVADHLKTAGAL